MLTFAKVIYFVCSQSNVIEEKESEIKQKSQQVERLQQLVETSINTDRVMGEVEQEEEKDKSILERLATRVRATQIYQE